MFLFSAFLRRSYLSSAFCNFIENCNLFSISIQRKRFFAKKSQSMTIEAVTREIDESEDERTRRREEDKGENGQRGASEIKEAVD